MPFRRTHRYRCTYSFPCDPAGFARHCYERVPIDAVDPPGHCNDDAGGENPDWDPHDPKQPLYDDPRVG